MKKDLFEYTLHLADNALLLGQRNAEWTGHGPVLEQDIAITNISLDFFGQARNFYQYAADLYNSMGESEKESCNKLLPRPWMEFNRGLQEDDLAFLRDEHQFRNLLITELPRGDWAYTVLRQFFFSAFQFEQYKKLEQSTDVQLAAIAEKSVKETAYHLRWSGEWVIRLGDGTEESRTRLAAALQDLWMFTGEMFEPALFEHVGAAVTTLREEWTRRISTVFEEATLQVPSAKALQSGGKKGIHTEYMGYVLAEMQHLQRTYPNATW